MIEQAVILCGGKGTRLGSLTEDLPKPLIPVRDEVLLDRTIRLLASHGVSRVLLLAGHLGDQIAAHYADGCFSGVQIEIFIEPRPLGTSGALPLVAQRLDEEFLLVYGDVFLDFDVGRLLRAGESMPVDVVATLMVRESDHPWDSHLVDVDSDGVVQEFIAKQEPGRLYKNCGNVAIYVCRRSILEHIPLDEPSDFGKDIFPGVLAAEGSLRAIDLEPGGFVRDMGTPDRLSLVEQYLERKDRSRIAQERPKAPRVAFLDRDGTLNHEVGLVSKPDQIRMIDGAADAVGRLTEQGWVCFILTNQPSVARGLCSDDELAEIHRVVLKEIENAGGRIEAIYYSPFHPETQHGEGVKELRRASDCRKPGAGMLYQAEEAHDLDLAEVVMIGDTWRDVLAGKAAGVRTVFLGNGESFGADLVAPDLKVAVSKLIDDKVFG